MTRTASQAFLDKKAELHTTDAFLWLLEIAVSDSESIRLVANDANVTWNSDTYEAVDFRVSPIRGNAEGQLPTVNVTVNGVTLEGQALLDANDGLVRKKTWLRIVNSALLADADAVREEFFSINSTTVNGPAIQFTLGRTDLFEKQGPKRRYKRDICGWQYKGRECEYSGNISTCQKTLADCIRHGDDEEANGDDRLHPNRFEGCPGILRERN